MVASLGDRYSEFLQPTAYRRAIRRPQPAEREYLAAQFTGTGIQVGPCCQQLVLYLACFAMLCKRCWLSIPLGQTALQFLEFMSSQASG